MAGRTATLPSKVEGLHAREVGDEVVVVNEVTQQAHVLRGVVADLWRAMDADTALDVSAEDYDAAVHALLRLGLIKPTGPSRRDVMRHAGTVAIGTAVISIGLPATQAAASHGQNPVPPSATLSGPSTSTTGSTVTLTFQAVGTPTPTGTVSFYEVTLAGDVPISGHQSVTYGGGSLQRTMPAGTLGTTTYRAVYTPTGPTSTHYYSQASATHEVQYTATGSAGNAVAPSYVSSLTNDNGNGGTTVSVQVPTGVNAPQAGDLLIAHVAAASAGSIAADASGWTVLGEKASGSSLRQIVFARVWATGDPSSYSFTLGASVRASAALAVYRNVNRNPVVANASNSGSTGSPTAPSVSTGGSNRLVVALFSATANSNFGTATGSQAFTESYDRKQLGASIASDRSDQYATSTSTGDITASNSGNWVARSLVLRGPF